MPVEITHHPGLAPATAVSGLLSASPRRRAVIVIALFTLPLLSILLTCSMAAFELAVTDAPAEYELDLRTDIPDPDRDVTVPSAYARLHRLSRLELTLRPTAFPVRRPVVKTSLIHNGRQYAWPLALLPGPDATLALRFTLAELSALPEGVSTLVVALQSPPRSHSILVRLGTLFARFWPAAPSRILYGIIENVP